MFAKYQTLTLSWPIFDQLAYHWTYTSAFDATRAVGISGHPIIYGSFAMAMALVALTIRGKFWYIPVTANFVGLMLSGTRSAWWVSSSLSRSGCCCSGARSPGVASGARSSSLLPP
ncbi:hypothetical protein NKG94_27605 [Micromonospora sp. M12]